MYSLNSRQKEPVLLISFNAGLEDESSIDTRPRRIYAVIKLTQELEVALVRTVPYETVRIPFPYLNEHLSFISRYQRTRPTSTHA